MFDVMEDCIHLKACRRIQRIGKKYRLNVPRYCTEECTAYQSGNTGNYITVDDAINYARSGYVGRGDPYDVYCSIDVDGMTLKDILEVEEG